MKTPFDPNKLVLSVARAIHRTATGSDELWHDMPEADQAEFLLLGHAAIAAHDKWLAESGFKIVPPGCMAAPENEREAKAMETIGRRWLKEHAGDRKLIVPARAPLVLN